MVSVVAEKGLPQELQNVESSALEAEQFVQIMRCLASDWSTSLDALLDSRTGSTHEGTDRL